MRIKTLLGQLHVDARGLEGYGVVLQQLADFDQRRAGDHFQAGIGKGIRQHADRTVLRHAQEDARSEQDFGASFPGSHQLARFNVRKFRELGMDRRPVDGDITLYVVDHSGMGRDY